MSGWANHAPSWGNSQPGTGYDRGRARSLQYPDSQSIWDSSQQGTGYQNGRARSSHYSDSQPMWDPSRRGSAPLRWHPDYRGSEQNYPQNNSNSSNNSSYLSPPSGMPFPTDISRARSLETIHEDGSRRSSIGLSPPLPRDYNSARRNSSTISDIIMNNNNNNNNNKNALPNNDQIGYNTNRRHSEGDLLGIASPGRYNKKAQVLTPNTNARRLNRGDPTGHERSNGNPSSGRIPRRRTPAGMEESPDYDALSEISDVKSEKSRMSYASEFSSLTSVSKMGSRRRSDADGNSVDKARSLSIGSPDGEQKARRTSIGGDRRSSVTGGLDSPPPSNTGRRRSTLTLGTETPEVFANLEIPIELLETPTSRLRKLLGPIIMFLLVVTVLASLAVAVYFAVVLKDTQAKQIKFLQATLKFTLARNDESPDFSAFTSEQSAELKQDYCKEVDQLYSTSELHSGYRGCEVDGITNERIVFKLYFLADVQRDEGEIVEVLAKGAPTVSGEAQLRTINNITLDISEESRDVALQVTKKAEDFYGANSQDLESDSVLPFTEVPKADIVEDDVSTPQPVSDPTNSTSGQAETKMDNTVLSDEICTSIFPEPIVAHPSSCTQYIQCEFGKPISRPCTGGLVFDPDSNACVEPRPDLPCAEVKPCDNINGGHFAHPTSCKLFIICDQGRTVVQSCLPDLVWDTVSKNCMPRKRGTDCEPA